mmetsp:Transcript_110640/g.309242  ORF Transcript_110640/g.309242 Transcript_110640/m.309242 type:complete len:196 (+) Transcript_110640:69-656(+)
MTQAAGVSDAARVAAEGHSAEELLRQMVATKGSDAAAPAPRDAPAPGSLAALEQGAPQELSDDDAPQSGRPAAQAQAKAPSQLALVEGGCVDSSPEREKVPRGHSVSSSESSKSRGRSRSKGKKNKKKEKKQQRSSSSSSGSRLRKKQRLNNFSSIRNVAQERAKMRMHRTAGAAAAAKVVQASMPLAAGPYFAP